MGSYSQYKEDPVSVIHWSPQLEMVLLILLLPTTVHSHGNMVWPPVWWDAGGQVGLTAGQHCSAGAQYSFEGDPAKLGVNCMWYTNYTHIPGEKTLDSALRTFPNIQPGLESFIAKNPWMAPGTAPVYSPCGAAGGNPKGCPEGDPPSPGQDCGQPYGGGFSHGPLAEENEFNDMVTTEWNAGSTVVAGWGMIANHGGGYSYRLCKLPTNGRAGLTEDCFQATPLEFASDFQWVQFGKDPSTAVKFLANRTKSGTHPPGSEWTKNPVPNCAGLEGGYFDKDDKCSRGLQFPAPAEGIFGPGVNIHNWAMEHFNWTMMDELKVPASLETGEYVLSFRWDCEQTAQIWSSCSNIRILPQVP